MGQGRGLAGGVLLALVLAVVGPSTPALASVHMVLPAVDADAPGPRTAAPATVYPTIVPEIDIIPFVPDPAPPIRVTPLPGTVALTFDDGPDPDWTPQILDILAEHGAVATFFVLGWKVDAHPDLARRIVEEGHSLQSHAYRHHDLPAKSSATVARLIADTATAIQAATGTTPVCLRPPGGGVSGRVRGIAADHGQVVVLWDARGNSGDYASHSSSTVLRRAAAWEAGDVTLMHDIWGGIYVRALPVILDDLASRGIGTSTICEPVEIMPVPAVG